MKKLLILLPFMSMILLISVPAAYSHNNSAPNGECYACHTGVDAETEVRIKGLPKKYIPGKKYRLTLIIQSDNESYGDVQGGFSLIATGGEINVSDDMNTQISHPYLTHTKEGSEQREWSFIWKAPEEKMEAEIQVMGIAANGDFSAAGDSIGTDVFDINPE